jgi:predicted Zn-dependent peptidase
MDSSEYWKDSLSNSLIYNYPLNRIYKTPTIIEKITKEDIRTMAKRVFGDDILEARLNPN